VNLSLKEIVFRKPPIIKRFRKIILIRLVVISLKTLKDKSVGDFISECIVVEPSILVSKAIGLMKENNSYEIFTQRGDKIGTATGGIF